MLSKKADFIGYGLDISSQMTQLAQATYPEFSFFTGSAMQLPFDNHVFDIVICSASFHHFPKPDNFLEEAKRVLKAGGKLVIAEINIPFFRQLYNAYLAKFSKEGDVKVYAFDELMRLIERAGFVLINGHKQFQIQYVEAHKKD
jgi:ubiquinone/menaquinone biosynthesis C-methylase UbiE